MIRLISVDEINECNVNGMSSSQITKMIDKSKISTEDLKTFVEDIYHDEIKTNDRKSICRLICQYVRNKQ